MIDLGDELANYGDEPKPEGATVTRYGSGPDGMHTFGKLADLQKGGFNVNPRTGRGIGVPPGDDEPAWPWTFCGTIDDDDLTIADLTVTVYDGDSERLVKMLRGDNPLMPNVRAGGIRIADIVVPDQPFKWKPQIRCSHVDDGLCDHCRKVFT